MQGCSKRASFGRLRAEWCSLHREPHDTNTRIALCIFAGCRKQASFQNHTHMCACVHVYRVCVCACVRAAVLRRWQNRSGRYQSILEAERETTNGAGGTGLGKPCTLMSSTLMFHFRFTLAACTPCRTGASTPPPVLSLALSIAPSAH